MCGEQPFGPVHYSAGLGSPPRVRGTALADGYLPLDAGITPACAGNSSFPAPWLRRRRDHPRVCGEQVLPLHQIDPDGGSPPRVRGTVDIRVDV